MRGKYSAKRKAKALANALKEANRGPFARSPLTERIEREVMSHNAWLGRKS